MRRLPGRLEGRDRPGRGDVEGGEGEQAGRGAACGALTRGRGGGQQPCEVRSDAGWEAGHGRYRSHCSVESQRAVVDSVELVVHWRARSRRGRSRSCSRGRSRSEVEDHPVSAGGGSQVEGGEGLRREVSGQGLVGCNSEESVGRKLD